MTTDTSITGTGFQLEYKHGKSTECYTRTLSVCEVFPSYHIERTSGLIYLGFLMVEGTMRRQPAIGHHWAGLLYIKLHGYLVFIVIWGQGTLH